MSQEDWLFSRSTGFVAAIVCFASATILALLDGDYWSALSFASLGVAVGILIGVEDRGRVLSVLFYTFATISILITTLGIYFRP